MGDSLGIDARRSDLMAAARAHASETNAKILAFNRYLQHIGTHVQEARKRAEAKETAKEAREALARAAEDLRVQEEELVVAGEQLEAQHQAMLAGRAALEEALGYYRELFLGGLDGFAVTSSSGVVKEANRAFASALRVDPRFFAGKPLIAFVTRGGCATFRELLIRARSSPGGTVAAAELELRPRRKGEPFRADVRVQTVAGASFAGHHAAVTELRWTFGLSARPGSVAEEVALARAKRVLATVAHDLRSPLAVLELAVSSLSPGLEDDPRTAGIGKTVRAAIQRMHHMVDDALASTTMDSGGLTLDRSPALLGDLLRESVSFLEPLAASRGIYLALELPPRDVMVDVDAPRIGQVLINLIDNALKFASKGTEVALSVHTHRDKVRVEVRDQGPGLSPEAAGHAFDLFWQANPGKGPGSGLGLAIAKHIVEKHGGEIGVESSPGIGAAFWFDLPLPRRREAAREDARTSSVYPIFATPDVGD